jgi:hypothetical protein
MDSLPSRRSRDSDRSLYCPMPGRLDCSRSRPSVRDPQALVSLPESERTAWRALWRDVDKLRSRVEPRDGPTKGR